MGLFDRFRREKQNPEAQAAPGGDRAAELLLEIAQIISAGDRAVLEPLNSCTDDPAGYFAAHRETYEERGVDAAEDLAQIQWLALVDILEEHGYVCERDWKDEKPDFLYFLRGLHGMERLNLEVEADWLEESGDIPAWCGVIAEKWSPRPCRVAAIGIDSDNYVLFPCTDGELERLRALAGQMGQSIDCVEKM